MAHAVICPTLPQLGLQRHEKLQPGLFLGKAQQILHLSALCGFRDSQAKMLHIKLDLEENGPSPLIVLINITRSCLNSPCQGLTQSLKINGNTSTTEMYNAMTRSILRLLYFHGRYLAQRSDVLAKCPDRCGTILKVVAKPPSSE